MVLEKIGVVKIEKGKEGKEDREEKEESPGKASRFFKGVIFSLMLYLLLNSDIFTETVMQYIPGSTSSNGLTVKGTIIHGIIFSVIWCLFMYTLVP